MRDASIETLMRCHLHLGTASHVLLRCGKPSTVRGFAELSRKAGRMEWHQWLPDNPHLQVKVTSKKSKLFHTDAIAQRIKEAIHNSLGTSQPSTPESPIVPLVVRIHRDVMQISIDTSQTPLHQRGYRLETAKAPLREDIAFAMLLAGGCDPRHHQGILDPFCGSGTIAIEAAAMLARLPPGRLRPAPLQGTKLEDSSLWNQLVDVSMDPLDTLTDSTIKVHGSDRDAGAIDIAESNAARAGLSSLIEFSNVAMSASPWFEKQEAAPESILVATNPPFGKRISKGGSRRRSDDHLWPLYQTLGNVIQKFGHQKTVRAVLLSHDLRLARKTGLEELRVQFTTDHGGLKVSALLA